MEIHEIPVEGWHRIVRFRDDAAGLHALVAVHDITLGPACGGCRIYPYPDFETGLYDVKRLSQGMTYKNALGNIPFGGGKAVVFADPERDRTPEMLHAFAKAVDSLDGLYYTAEDSGMTESDLAFIRSHTPYAAGIRTGSAGGSPSPFTARGVWRGMQAAVRYRTGARSLDGLRVCIQGAGAVGMALAELVRNEGGILYVSDISRSAVGQACSRYNATAIPPESGMDTDADIFSPCALGGAVDTQAPDRIRARIIAGAANNQLRSPETDAALHRRGILYAPDYVINAAGVISVGLEILGTWTPAEMNRRIDRIGDTLTEIFTRSEKEDRPTGEIADRMVRDILRKSGKKKRTITEHAVTSGK